MSRSVGIPRRIRATPGSFAALALLLMLLPSRSIASGHFPGYAEGVRNQCERLLASSGPGNEETVSKEARVLRKRMNETGILSINAIPDLVFEKASREGWTDRVTPCLRAVATVAPFSVQNWAWLVKEDILGLRVPEFLHDAEGLSGSMRRFAPALMGYVAWLISYLSAAACWFAAWASVALFLRARPSLEADISRVFRIPLHEYSSPAIAVLLFLLPLLGGQGLAVVASFWLILSAGYLRRGELVMLTTAILLLAGVLVAGGVVQSLQNVAGNVKRGGWLVGEGGVPQEWPGEGPRTKTSTSKSQVSWMVTFAKARAAMHGGDPAAAERLWSDLVRTGRGIPEVLNNRGIAVARQGRIREALVDFESALQRRPDDAPSSWNAYQTYLQLFNLERARMIQPLAWGRVQKMAPFDFRPAEMEQGEWVASGLPVGEVWMTLLSLRSDWLAEAGESDYSLLFFQPLPAAGALVFLALIWLAAGIWKVLSLRIWVYSTCRGCGIRTLIVGSRESSDVCNPCRAQVGGGHRAGEERDRRVQGIVLHRRYVRICSVLVPGSGALWAGKEFRTMVYGLFLALSLAGVSVSFGGREGGGLMGALQTTVMWWTAAVSFVLWAGGAIWGIRSFTGLQERCNIARER